MFDHSRNSISLGEGSECRIPKGVEVKDSMIRINGKSKLVLEPGAHVFNSTFQIDSDSTVHIDSGTILDGVDICVWQHSELFIGQECRMNHVRLVIDRGKVRISASNILSSGGRSEMATMTVADGSVSIADHNRLQNSTWVRFGGCLDIGRYNCINEGSEIRCDESVKIGSYNMISYDCDIWDTNTHCHYSLEEKKRMFENDFPSIGLERNKPETRPVSIGDGNWIGKRSCILKGSIIGNENVVGTRAIVSNTTVSDKQRVLPSKSEVK